MGILGNSGGSSSPNIDHLPILHNAIGPGPVKNRRAIHEEQLAIPVATEIGRRTRFGSFVTGFGSFVTGWTAFENAGHVHDLALRSVRLAATRRESLLLCGDGDLVSTTRASRHRCPVGRSP
jgi:hypothetical protein